MSIRRRTLWLVMGILVFGTLLIALYNFHDSSHEIAEIYDAQLAQNARLLQGVMQMPLASAEREQLYQAFNDALGKAGGQLGHPYESKMAFQVWNRAGERVVHSASAPLVQAGLHAPGFHDLWAGEQLWRGFLLPDDTQGLLIWVGESDAVRQDLVERIVRHTLGPNLLGILLLAALVWWGIGWGLRPLNHLADVIRSRHADSLEPLQLEPLPTELEPMQAALNRLLFQIEDLLQRERRFIGDAAHEMRTPLAILRVHAQNAIAAETEGQRDEALQFLIGGVDRLTRVVNQLLTMARVQPGPTAPPWPPRNVEPMVREALAELTPWIFGKGLELSFEAPPGRLLACIDEDALGIVLHNLVSNAVSFSPPGGEVTVRLRDDGRGNLLLSVEDQGPGIDQEQAARLFERFYSRDNPHGAGLGLAIVEMIARRHGGSITLENRPEGGLRAVLQIPKSWRSA